MKKPPVHPWRQEPACDDKATRSAVPTRVGGVDDCALCSGRRRNVGGVEDDVPDSQPLGADLIAPHWTPPAIDSTVATPARIYSYLLGGKDPFPADRAAAEKALEAMPAL